MTAFLFFSSVAFAAALIPLRTYAVKFIILVVIVFPTSHAYSHVASFNGLYFYDLFTAAYLVRVAGELFLLRRPALSVGRVSVVFLLSFLVFLLAYMPIIDVNKFYFKEFRPILNVLFLLSVYDLYFKSKYSLDVRSLGRYSIVSALAAFLKYFFLVSGYYGYQDEYYEVNSYRYLDASAYFCAIYLIVKIRSMRSMRDFDASLVFSASAVMLGNSRFMLIGIVVAAVFGTHVKPKKMLIGFVFFAVILALFLFFSSYFQVVRVTDNLSYGGIAEQLAGRFSPAMVKIREFQWFNFLIGLGPDISFEIPWFEYRGLEVSHSNIDSAYLTYYVKYGVIGIMFLWAFSYILVPVSVESKYIRVFVFLMFFVEATPYHPICAGFVASVYGLKRAGAREG